MPDSTCSPYTGLTFEILAGTEYTTFIAHAKVLARSSKLKATVDGDWKDSHDRKIVLTDWDKETVGRLLDWLYTDEYTNPDPGVVKVVPNPASQQPEMVTYVFTERDHPSQSSNSIMSESLTRSDNDIAIIDAPEEFESKEITRPVTPLMNQEFKNAISSPKYSNAENFTAWKETCQPRTNTLSYESTLLAHASLYCLADYMLLPDLQSLTFRRLQNTLDFINNFTARTPVVADLVKVVKYIYANTSRPHIGEEPLQKLVTTFIALNIGAFDDGEMGEVRGLFDQGGDIAVDVWEKARRNVGELDRKLRESEEKVGELKREVKARKKKKRPGEA